MVFSSTVFLFVFLPLLLLLYYLPFPRRRAWRNAILLLFSILFYAWGEPLFVFALLALIVVNWSAGSLLSRSSTGKKWFLFPVILLDVSLLILFKYAPAIARALPADNVVLERISQLHLPIGISFFTFQIISYILDLYRGRVQVKATLPRFALYISMFPQLVAGPIVRYNEIETQLLDRKESFDQVADGLGRFICGLGKKVLLADFLARTVDAAFSAQGLTVIGAWLGAVAYTLQIYFDFSGYSDMAIGLGRMFGFHFAENFRYPYIASSGTDFWRRWHISLSRWFRDYVYIPLGGNRHGARRTMLNLFVVWLLTGIWHGANWTFVIWGLLWFAVLVAEKISGHAETNTVVSHFFTLLIVILGFVIFRSPDTSYALQYIGKMFGLGAAGVWDQETAASLRSCAGVLLAGCIGATPLLNTVFSRLKEKGGAWLRPVWLTAVFVLAVAEMVTSSFQPFIYFDF